LARLHREHEQAEPDDGHRKHGNPDNLNPKGLGHGTLSRMIRLRSKQRNGPEPEAKKPDLNIQAELSACWLGRGPSPAQFPTLGGN